MIRAIFALFVLAALAACAELRPEGVASLPETGLDGAFSRQAVVGRDGRTILVGQVFVLRRGGQTFLTAELGQMWNSRQNRLRMDAAWNDGSALAFAPARRSERYCIARSGCQGWRTGTFAFSAAEFDRAAREGFRATLTGPDAAVRVEYRAALFSEAIGLARGMDLWPP